MNANAPIAAEPGTGRAGAGRGATLKRRAVELLGRRPEVPIVAVTVLLGVYFLNTAVDFGTSGNFGTLASFVAATAIIAVGATLLMVSGEMDLSLGQTFAFAPLIFYYAHDAGLPLLLAVVVGVLACCLVGLLNGLVTTVIGISSFIVTLGTFFLLNGLNLVISDGTPKTTPGDGSFATVMGGGTYAALLWAVGFAILLQLVLTKTRAGNHTIATGGNMLGASEAGIKVRWVKIRAFMLASAFAGFAGILEAVRVTSIDPLAGGPTLTFQAISAIVIGGTLLTGGSGTVIGSFVGAVFLGVLRDGFTLAGVNAFAFDLIVGVAIIVAMILTVGIGRLRRGLR